MSRPGFLILEHELRFSFNLDLKILCWITFGFDLKKGSDYEDVNFFILYGDFIIIINLPQHSKLQ